MLYTSRESLQEGLNILHDYCDRWKLTVNTDKSKVMIFRKGGRLSNQDKWYYGGELLEIVKEFTYLGIVFSTTGSFSATQKTLAGQGQKAIYKLQKYISKFENLKADFLLDLFDKLVSPILCYGAEVWGFHKAHAIEKVHMQFCKKVLKLKWNTQNNFVYAELGRQNMINIRYLRIVKYWFKILKADVSRLIKQIYNILLHDSENGCINWVSLLKNLLLTHGFADVWYRQGAENQNIFLSEFKQRLKDNYGQNCNIELENSSRAKHYILYYEQFTFATYLKNVDFESHRVALCRFRTGNHRLAIETGRWHKPNPIPLPDRKCIFCNKLEDEYHFLLECSLYKDLRKIYVPKYVYNRPNMEKFKYIMSTENIKIMQKLATFVYKAFKIRENALRE